MEHTTPEPCIFCRIVAGEFGTEFVAQSEHGVAFRDIAPKAPIHVLVVPKRHISALRGLSTEDAALAGDLLLLARDVAEREGLFDGGFRLLTNDGADAGQDVFHLHFHVIGGRKLSLSV